MAPLLNAGEVLSLNAHLYPGKIGARDLGRAMGFHLWNQRACRLANAFAGLGLTKGDRVAILAYNCIEWVEIYGATAKAGLIAVPINFRLVGTEIRYVAENCEASLLIVQDELRGAAEDAGLSIRTIHFGKTPCPAGWLDYETLLAAASDREPGISVSPEDPWTIMYTSGTTGRPKGAVRSHRASAMLSLVTSVEMGLGRSDTPLLVMPLCHGNSVFFFGVANYCGATCSIYSAKSFDPEQVVATLAAEGISFTSLVPTHYIMMLELSARLRGRYNLDTVKKLLISSAPARRDTKLAVMDFFRNSGLYEGYGSTEAGWVTMLHPDEQFTRLGSIGRECLGSRPVRLFDEKGADVAGGEPGELFSCNSYTFDGYWKMPEKTAEAFRDGYCSVGDLARRDADGFLHLVDRKSNMIISGGENVYPSEVEALLATHAQVKDVAVIGVRHDKWGESVHAVIVPRDGDPPSPDELLDWCKTRIAGYKRPRSVSLISDAEMPRTATGKIQHRQLRERYTTPISS